MKLVEIKWDNALCGVICLTVSILCYYAGLILAFDLDWKFIGRLQRDPQTFGAALVVGSILLVFGVMFLMKSKRVYGHVGENH